MPVFIMRGERDITTTVHMDFEVVAKDEDEAREIWATQCEDREFGTEHPCWIPQWESAEADIHDDWQGNDWTLVDVNETS
jgi:hypothetical protein